MKLISLKINGFKNLNTEIDFRKSEGISVFVGNNGSGKSNVLEAISAIFYGLYDETNERRCKFTYVLEYSINGKNVKIQQLFFKGKKDAIGKLPTEILEGIPDVQEELRIVSYYIDGVFIKILGRDFLPSNIIALYSGEETRLYDDYYLNDYDKYIKNIITTKKGILEEISMSFIGKDFWNIALLTMATSYYDLSKIVGDFEIDKLFFEFNEKNLEKFNRINPNEVTGFVLGLSKILDLTLDKFQENFAQTHKELFKLLSVAYLPKEESYNLIEKFDLELVNGEEKFMANCLSEGQKKQILIYFVTEILADENSIILLDEPDSYIHVGSKDKIKGFCENFIYAGREKKDWNEENRSGEVIMTTHSPTLMHCFSKNNEDNIFSLEEGKVIPNNKREILRQITGDSMSFAEQQIILNTDKDILLVEGKLDEVFMKEALFKLTDKKYKDLKENIMFIPTGGASGLRLFIDRFEAKDDQKIIGILDGDKAGKDEIKEILDNNLTKELKKNNFVKIDSLKNTFLLILPKPSNITNAQFEIEDYFPISKMTEIANKQIDTCKVLKDFVIKKEMVKKKLETECIKFIEEDFKGFKILFDLILSIKKKLE